MSAVYPLLRCSRVPAIMVVVLTWSLSTHAISTREDAPDFVLECLDGPNLRLDEYRGEGVLINFWASWCGRATRKCLFSTAFTSATKTPDSSCSE